MSRISLRWRITILMGILVGMTSALLTILSIRNMTDNFVIPLTNIPVTLDGTVSDGESGNVISFTEYPRDLSEDIRFIPEINLEVESARQSFSVFSYLYLALVTAGSMIAAYYLAGRAMRPISELNHEIESIDGRSLSKRVRIPKTKDEMESLSRSFNELFERLEREFEKEKRFSANVAHELKTPLATIMTSAQVLKMNDRTTVKEYRENLDITLQSVRRLSGVLDGLLLLGRSEEGITRESINITRMLHEITEEIKPCYCDKNISLTYDLREEYFMGNRTLLYRAFLNLIENAYKYTEKGGSITITSDRSGTETILRISDTGIGIPADDIHHIFEPFYRADKSRSRKIAGAGLGLSIAKEVFDLHKAAVSISNRDEGGTVVEVRWNA